MYAIGVDIGGTKIAAGVIDEAGSILAQVKIPTNAEDVTSIDRSIAQAVNDLTQDYDVSAIGLAAAGFISSDRKTVSFAPNIAWRDYPLANQVKLLTSLNVPIVVENDANAAGWAEFRFGAAQDTNNMVMLTVGTGLGGAVVVDGRLVRGKWGLAAELGHINVVPNGQACGCGHNGCWEQYASGSALVRQARQIASSRPWQAQALLDLADGQPGAITGPLVTVAAQNGDATSVALLRELGFWIGRGAASMAATLDPEIFVIGGGVGAAGGLLLEPIREAFLSALPARGYRKEARIELAAFGNEAGVVGAGDLAFH